MRIMRALTLLTFFACVFLATNVVVSSATTGLGDYVEDKDEFYNGFDDEDRGNDFDDEEGGLDDDDDADDDTDDDDDDDFGEDGDDDVDEDDHDDDDFDEDDDDDFDEDDDDDDDDFGDDNDDDDEDDGDDFDDDDDDKRRHYRPLHHHRGHRRGMGMCFMSCHRAVRECKKYRSGRVCILAFKKCLAKCGSGSRPRPHPFIPKCGKRCVFPLMKCLRSSNSSQAECFLEFKDCFEKCRMNCSRNATLPVQMCLKNCTEQLLECLGEGKRGFMCLKQMAFCAMKCKRNWEPRTHPVKPRQCFEKCKQELTGCDRRSMFFSGRINCRRAMRMCMMRCKSGQLQPTMPPTKRPVQRLVDCMQNCRREASKCNNWSCRVSKIGCLKSCRQFLPLQGRRPQPTRYMQRGRQLNLHGRRLNHHVQKLPMIKHAVGEIGRRMKGKIGRSMKQHFGNMLYG